MASFKIFGVTKIHQFCKTPLLCLHIYRKFSKFLPLQMERMKICRQCPMNYKRCELSTTESKMSMKNRLLNQVTPPRDYGHDRITVIGAGQVGMAYIFSVLAQNISRDVVIIDVDPNIVRGEMLDLQHGSQFLNGARIVGSTDYAASAGSRICVIAAGVRQAKGETRLALLQRNADVLKKIVPQIVKYSPDSIIILVSNPVDVMTYVAWKISGFPINRVIGSGTHLDTARFQFLMSQKLGISPKSCNCCIIGEHGDSSVAVWSTVEVGGVPLKHLNPDIGTEKDPENWKELHKQVIQAGYEVRNLKGCTSWAIALTAADISSAILTNSGRIIPVSVNVKGQQGIKEDIFISLPAVLGNNGVNGIVKQPLTESELAELQKSAAVIAKAQSSLKL